MAAVSVAPDRLGHAQMHSSSAWQPPSTLVFGLGVYAAYHLGLALFMAIAPHAFYEVVGPFGPRNDHYIRDVATYNAALGFGLLAAVRLPSWRVPVLAITTIQFALHSVNHLVDATTAHPQWVGWFDFAALSAGTLLLASLLRAAVLQSHARATERGR